VVFPAPRKPVNIVVGINAMRGASNPCQPYQC
jgi:hypothetical protein